MPQRSTLQCYLKVIAMREGDQRIVGMHLIGPNSGDILQGYAAAMKSGMTMTILKNTTRIFPTVAEEFIKLWIIKRSEIDPHFQLE